MAIILLLLTTVEELSSSVPVPSSSVSTMIVGSGLGNSRLRFFEDLAGCKVCGCCSPDPEATGDVGLGPGGPGGGGLLSEGGVAAVAAVAAVPGWATTEAYDRGSSSLSDVSIGPVC